MARRAAVSGGNTKRGDGKRCRYRSRYVVVSLVVAHARPETSDSEMESDGQVVGRRLKEFWRAMGLGEEDYS
jgi:hypothetical protein